MEIDPSILVTMLNPLETDRLLTRERDSADRRRHTISLTEAGSRRLAQAAAAQRAAEDELFGGLDSKQREQLRALLLALRDSTTEPECAGVQAGLSS